VGGALGFGWLKRKGAVLNPGGINESLPRQVFTKLCS
jgi:hypothetical protein